MGFAGIYSEIKDAEGRSIYTTAIITTKPNSLMEDIHNRMPVILERKYEASWLDKESKPDVLKKLLKPYDAKDMEAYRVSTLVNSPKNDGPELVEEIKL